MGRATLDSRASKRRGKERLHAFAIPLAVSLEVCAAWAKLVGQLAKVYGK
jgi:hypothetical protein